MCSAIGAASIAAPPGAARAVSSRRAAVETKEPRKTTYTVDGRLGVALNDVWRYRAWSVALRLALRVGAPVASLRQIALLPLQNSSAIIVVEVGSSHRRGRREEQQEQLDYIQQLAPPVHHS